MSIPLVKGDDGPDINITLKDANTGDPGDPDSWDGIDVSDPDTTVSMKFRKLNTTTVLETITLSKVDGGNNGDLVLVWNITSLDVDAGNYEGEIEIDENGKIQTVFDTLKFKIREQF